ncbi:TPA: ORF6N domain-containing protein [Citrobacter freundii]|nr:ORF6N domain-containing protein [Citrobacter amalonaticus]HAT2287604.1 ORF6N domain-containing protein [Citrobacter freundii]HAT2351736.1 ORF6N domain-containing protein [Citrobacter freundii]HAT2433273.1 ORF6N domain-containing protein [Citrobacter freundii]HAT2503135.1 ORF6N domain-containing protein [Citrobacter freundii]
MVIRCKRNGSAVPFALNSGENMTNQVMGLATPKGSATSVVSVNNSAVPVITYRNQRVVTTDSLAAGYSTTAQNITNNFNRNKNRFIEGKHYFRIEGEEVENLRNSLSYVQISPKTRTLYLWTERGASHHAKMLETEQAWDFFEQLEDHYFGMREVYGVTLPDISDPIKLARAWADAMEAKQQAEAITHQQAEYIEHLESLFTDGLSPVQFCKRLNGVNTSKISAWLVSANWLYDDNPEGRSAQWRVRSYARDKYLTEKSTKVSPNSAVSFTTYQPVLLRDGAVWLYKNYLKGKLPMKVTWNGKFTHDKELAGGTVHG